MSLCNSMGTGPASICEEGCVSRRSGYVSLTVCGRGLHLYVRKGVCLGGVDMSLGNSMGTGPASICEEGCVSRSGYVSL
jgi:hypothetical protein